MKTLRTYQVADCARELGDLRDAVMFSDEHELRRECIL
jgi:hypothetical protein